MTPDLPVEILIDIMEHVGDWELAQAVGIPTSLPQPSEWARATRTRPRSPHRAPTAYPQREAGHREPAHQNRRHARDPLRLRQCARVFPLAAPQNVPRRVRGRPHPH